MNLRKVGRDREEIGIGGGGGISERAWGTE